MQKFLRIFALAVIMTFAMSVFVHAEEIIKDTTLEAGETYTDITVKGGSSSDPITITIPEGGVTVASTNDNNDCIKITNGSYAKIVGGVGGGVIYHNNSTSDYYTTSIINVGTKAHLTISNVTIKGVSKETDSKVSSLNTSNVTKNEMISYTIKVESDGELTLDNAILEKQVSPSHYVFCSCIYSDGTLNILDATIKNIVTRGGYGIMMMNDNCKTTIKKAVLYNCGTTVYHAKGTLEIDDALMVGGFKGSYNNSGSFKVGTIANDVGATVKCKSDNIEVPVKKGDTLVANPAHDLVTTIDGKEYCDVFTNNQWYFLNKEEQHHYLRLDTNEMYLDNINKRTGSVVATVICADDTHSHTPEITAEPSGILEITGPIQTDGADKYKFTINALNAPISTDVTLTVSVNKGATKETCIVHVTKDETITNTDKTLNNGETYSNIIIDKVPSNNITITVNGNVNIASTNDDAYITVKSGNATIKGSGRLIFQDAKGLDVTSLIKVESGASLTLDGGIVIDGSDKPVLYGINNKGDLSLRNCTITNVQADTDIEEDGIIYNNGTGVTINGAVIYGNTGYAVYDCEGKKATFLQGGLVAGKFTDDFKPGNFLIGTVSLPSADAAKIKSASTTAGSTPYEVYAKDGDMLAAYNSHIVTAEIDGASYKGIYSATTKRWDFAEATKPVVSFVKGKNATKASFATSDFSNSHTRTNGTTTVQKDITKDASSSSVSTAFIKDTAASGDTAYILCDVVIPSNSNVYIGNSSAMSNYHNSGFNLNSIAVNDTSGKIYRSSSTSEKTFKYKFTADGSKEQYGIIIDNLYADGAVAYMRECTEEQYTAATDYTEAKAESDTAAVSL